MSAQSQTSSKRSLEKGADSKSEEPEIKKQKPTKVAWIPEVAGGGQDDYSISKFGGHPWLEEDEDWPDCQGCEKKIAFFLQLNIEELPEVCKSWFNVKSGLLQMFYCTECDDFEPFNGGHLIRHVKVASKKGKSKVEPPPELRIFDSKKIIQWTEYDRDLPTWEEAEEKYGIRSEDDDDDDGPEAGDKLGGFPCWVQSIEYPECNKDGCEEEMRLVFQVDSDCNIDYMFGDVGCGHITQCPTHKDVFAFGWACG